MPAFLTLVCVLLSAMGCSARPTYLGSCQASVSSLFVWLVHLDIECFVCCCADGFVCRSPLCSSRTTIVLYSASFMKYFPCLFLSAIISFGFIVRRLDSPSWGSQSRAAPAPRTRAAELPWSVPPHTPQVIRHVIQRCPFVTLLLQVRATRSRSLPALLVVCSSMPTKAA